MADRPTVFISYSRADQDWKDRLLKHLGVLARQGLVDVWDDSRIGAGADWKRAIDQAMVNAHVAVLLITADFLNSEFVLREEVPRLLRRQKSEGLNIYPILVKPCDWEAVDWLAAIQMRPSGRAISKGSSHDIEEDLTAIAKEVREILMRRRVVASSVIQASTPREIPHTPAEQSRAPHPPNTTRGKIPFVLLKPHTWPTHLAVAFAISVLLLCWALGVFHR